MSKIDLQENITDEEFDIAAVPSLDDFMRELEEREGDLEASGIKDIELESPYVSSDKPAKAKSANSSSGNSAAAANSASIAAENQKLVQQIEQLKKDRLEMSATLNRRQADFDSFRKRTERERNETFQRVLVRLASKMIPVVDNLNRAIDSAAKNAESSNEIQHFLDGIVLVNQQIQDTLNEMGIQPILCVGQPFDPHFHEAVATEERDDFAQNTVIEELLRGYRVGDTVIRATMVKVSV